MMGENRHKRSHSSSTGAEPITYADDLSLVARARRGDHEAYTELYRRHITMVHHVILRMTRNREDTEDVIQEAFLKAFVHLNGFHGESAFSTWLTRIAINGALMMRRKKANQRAFSIEGTTGTDEIQIADQRPDIEAQLQDNERDRRVNRAIRRLSPTLRQPLQLQLYGELPVKDVAKRLDISVPAAKSRLLRARAGVERFIQTSGSRIRVFQKTPARPIKGLGAR